jgi:hypothetical protein
MLMGVRMPVTIGVAVLMRMTFFMRMVMSILLVVFMLMYMRMGDARRMQCLMLLFSQFVPDGLKHSILDIFSFFLSSPRHYSTSSASTNTLMV